MKKIVWYGIEFVFVFDYLYIGVIYKLDSDYLYIGVIYKIYIVKINIVGVIYKKFIVNCILLVLFMN